MAAAVAELAGVIHVGGVAVAELRGAEVDVNGGDTSVDEDVLNPGLGHADLRLGMAEVEEAAGGAHGPEGGGGDDVDFFGGGGQALFVDVVHDLVSSEDDGLAGRNAVVDLFVCLHWFLFQSERNGRGRSVLTGIHDSGWRGGIQGARWV